MAELRWGTATDPGRVRPGNEDSVLAVAQVFAVADGMGGHAAGEVASAVALQTIAARMGQQPASIASVTDVVRAANEAVYRRSLAEPTTRGMGTTLALVAPATGADGKDHLVVANVGDSRVYLCTDGELRQLTRDHSYVEEMLAAGQITADEARRHPHRHVVTRVVGIEPSVAVDTWLVTPEPGDPTSSAPTAWSTGVRQDIARIIRSRLTRRTAAGASLRRPTAGGRDNISVVVVESSPRTAIALGRRRCDHPGHADHQPLGGWLPDLAHGWREHRRRLPSGHARRAPHGTGRHHEASAASSPGGPSCSPASSWACSWALMYRCVRSPRLLRRLDGSVVVFRGGPKACSGSNPQSVGRRGQRAELTPGSEPDRRPPDLRLERGGAPLRQQ
jgi:protein phosphatase